MIKLSSNAAERAIWVKCGGFSSQLATHVEEKIDGDPLWGSRYDATNPTAVVQTHMDFLQNGAQIILSNTYQSSIEGFMQHLHLSREQSIELMRKSVRHAKEAKEKFLQQQKADKNVTANIDDGMLPLILASIGPYGAHLHDGSEYNGSYVKRVTKQKLQNWHKPRIEACLAEGVDGLAVETIPCQQEAEAVVEMILNDYADVKFWVSFQCKNETSLAHGENFANATLAIWKLVTAHKAETRLYGIGVNCVNPKFVTPLFKSLHAALAEENFPIPLLVYSNRGETYDADLGEWTGCDKCVPLECYVPEWLNLGAKIIGGCCRVYPKDIVQIRKTIHSIISNNN